jgi:hypothetical protein
MVKANKIKHLDQAGTALNRIANQRVLKVVSLDRAWSAR